MMQMLSSFSFFFFMKTYLFVCLELLRKTFAGFVFFNLFGNHYEYNYASVFWT